MFFPAPGRPGGASTQVPRPQVPRSQVPTAYVPRAQVPRAQFTRDIVFLLDWLVVRGMQKEDLKQRTFRFSQEVRRFIKRIPRTIGNMEDCRQLVRSSGSVGANYLEADNALSQKDSLMRIRICLKESRESEYWLRLLDLDQGSQLDASRERLVQESCQGSSRQSLVSWICRILGIGPLVPGSSARWAALQARIQVPRPQVPRS